MTDPHDEEFITAAFTRLDPVDASPTLRRRVAQIPIERPRVSSSVWPFSRIWQSVVALGALCALGVATGSLTSPNNSSELTEKTPRPAAGMLVASDTSGGDPEALSGEEELDDPLEGMFALAFSESWQDWDTETAAWMSDVDGAVQ